MRVTYDPHSGLVSEEKIEKNIPDSDGMKKIIVSFLNDICPGLIAKSNANEDEDYIALNLDVENAENDDIDKIILTGKAMQNGLTKSMLMKVKINSSIWYSYNSVGTLICRECHLHINHPVTKELYTLAKRYFRFMILMGLSNVVGDEVIPLLRCARSSLFEPRVFNIVWDFCGINFHKNKNIFFGENARRSNNETYCGFKPGFLIGKRF